MYEFPYELTNDLRFIYYYLFPIELGNFKKIPEMLGSDGECPAVHPKAKFWRFSVKNRKKSAVKHSIEKPILLNTWNLTPNFCPRKWKWILLWPNGPQVYRNQARNVFLAIFSTNSHLNLEKLIVYYRQIQPELKHKDSCHLVTVYHGISLSLRKLKNIGWRPTFRFFNTLWEKCPNTEFFMVLIFPYSDWIRRFTE